MAGPEEVWQRSGLQPSGGVGYSEALRAYLRQVASKYDVIDYAYDQLPYRRSDFSARPLFVARSVLLDHHFTCVKIPEVILWRQKVKRWLTGEGKRQRQAFGRRLETARLTMDNADLINVANDDDRAVLTAAGINPAKIAVIPYGLSTEEIDELAVVNRSDPSAPRLCFLGTFDHRKGGADLPRLLEKVCARFPNCQLRLIGTAGLHQTAERVRSFFPRSLRKNLEVVPRFRRNELAGLLEGCTVGVFPSYVEGFGFAVLEMMAAGLPVAAYRSPGPTMMLADDFLVPRGDVSALGVRVINWLENEADRQQAAGQCRRRAGDFSWQTVGVHTDAIYRR